MIKEYFKRFFSALKQEKSTQKVVVDWVVLYNFDIN